MKSRILAIASVLAILGVMVGPGLALAATTVVNGTLEVPTVTGISPASGVQGNTYTLVSITGTFLTGASAVTFSGTDVTANTIVVAGDGNSLTCTVAVGSSALATVRDVSVVATGGTAVLASAFTVTASSISVTAPAGFGLGIMNRATNTVQGPNGTVTTNAQNWQVTATGTASNGGYMHNGSAPLTAKFQIGKNGSAWTDASETLTYNQTDPTSFPFWAQQIIDSDDPPGTYSITITFTGSAQ